MARYCISYSTMKTLGGANDFKSMADLVKIISSCSEFSEFQLRMPDRKILNDYNKNKKKATIRFPMEGKIKSTEMKVNCLMQAQLGCMPIQDFSLSQEVTRIFRIACRVTRCLVEILLKKPHHSQLLAGLLLDKCVHSQLWEQSKHIARQLTGIGVTLANSMVNAGLVTFSKIEGTNPREIELIVNRHPPFGNTVVKAVSGLPKYDLSIEQSEPYKADEATVELAVRVANKEELESVHTAGKKHCCILVVADQDDRIVYQSKLFDSSLAQLDMWTRTIKVCRANKGGELKVNLISQSWVGLDINTSFSVYYTRSFSPDVEQADCWANPVAVAQVPPGESDTGSLRPGYAWCNHKCANKSTCAHKCCKEGVKVKPVSHQRMSKGASHTLATQSKISALSATPLGLSTQTGESAQPPGNLSRYAYTKQQPQRLHHELNASTSTGLRTLGNATDSAAPEQSPPQYGNFSLWDSDCGTSEPEEFARPYTTEHKIGPGCLSMAATAGDPGSITATEESGYVTKEDTDCPALPAHSRSPDVVMEDESEPPYSPLVPPNPDYHSLNAGETKLTTSAIGTSEGLNATSSAVDSGVNIVQTENDADKAQGGDNTTTHLSNIEKCTSVYKLCDDDPKNRGNPYSSCLPTENSPLSSQKHEKHISASETRLVPDNVASGGRLPTGSYLCNKSVRDGVCVRDRSLNQVGSTCDISSTEVRPSTCVNKPAHEQHVDSNVERLCTKDSERYGRRHFEGRCNVQPRMLGPPLNSAPSCRADCRTYGKVLSPEILSRAGLVTSNGTTVGLGPSNGTTIGLGPSNETTVGLGPSNGTTVGLGPSNGTTVGLGPSNGTTIGLGPSNGTTLGMGPSNGTTIGLGPSNGTTVGLGPSNGTTLGMGPSNGTTIGLGTLDEMPSNGQKTYGSLGEYRETSNLETFNWKTAIGKTSNGRATHLEASNGKTAHLEASNGNPSHLEVSNGKPSNGKPSHLEASNGKFCSPVDASNRNLSDRFHMSNRVSNSCTVKGNAVRASGRDGSGGTSSGTSTVTGDKLVTQAEVVKVSYEGGTTAEANGRSPQHPYWNLQGTNRMNEQKGTAAEHVPHSDHVRGNKNGLLENTVASKISTDKKWCSQKSLPWKEVGKDGRFEDCTTMNRGGVDCSDVALEEVSLEENTERQFSDGMERRVVAPSASCRQISPSILGSNSAGNGSVSNSGMHGSVKASQGPSMAAQTMKQPDNRMAGQTVKQPGSSDLLRKPSTTELNQSFTGRVPGSNVTRFGSHKLTSNQPSDQVPIIQSQHTNRKPLNSSMVISETCYATNKSLTSLPLYADGERSTTGQHSSDSVSTLNISDRTRDRQQQPHQWADGKGQPHWSKKSPPSVHNAGGSRDVSSRFAQVTRCSEDSSFGRKGGQFSPNQQRTDNDQHTAQQTRDYNQCTQVAGSNLTKRKRSLDTMNTSFDLSQIILPKPALPANPPMMSTVSERPSGQKPHMVAPPPKVSQLPTLSMKSSSGPPPKLACFSGLDFFMGLRGRKVESSSSLSTGDPPHTTPNKLNTINTANSHKLVGPRPAAIVPPMSNPYISQYTPDKRTTLYGSNHSQCRSPNRDTAQKWSEHCSRDTPTVGIYNQRRMTADGSCSNPISSGHLAAKHSRLGYTLEAMPPLPEERKNLMSSAGSFTFAKDSKLSPLSDLES